MNKTSSSLQKGFTLIELMVALTLGLILVAAAIQLFTGGLMSSHLQRANAEIQDSGVFGVDYMLRDLRLANVGNVNNLEINDQTSYGGIVFTASDSSSSANVNFVPKVSSSAYLNSALLSRGAGDTVSTMNNHWKGLSNVKDASTGTALVSDQLTIQFIAPSNMFNCEGVEVFAGDLVVQRYFLRVDANGSGTGNTDLALACDANTPASTAAGVSAQPEFVTGLGTAGQIVIPRVDHFHVLLKARNHEGNLVEYTIPQYRDAATEARRVVLAADADADNPEKAAVDVPRVLAVQVSVLIRSTNNAKNNVVDPAQASYVMLDQTVKANDSTTRFLRRVYSSTVALRNAMGEKL